MQPGEIYQLAIVLAALFVAPFNAMARVVILAWFAGRGLWTAGMSEPLADFLAELLILWFGRHCQTRGAARAAWLLSVPLAATNLAWALGWLHVFVAWWVILITATVRLAILPFAIERESVANTVRSVHEALDRILFWWSRRRLA